MRREGEICHGNENHHLRDCAIEVDTSRTINLPSFAREDMNTTAITRWIQHGRAYTWMEKKHFNKKL